MNLEEGQILESLLSCKLVASCLLEGEKIIVGSTSTSSKNSNVKLLEGIIIEEVFEKREEKWHRLEQEKAPAIYNDLNVFKRSKIDRTFTNYSIVFKDRLDLIDEFKKKIIDKKE